MKYIHFTLLTSTGEYAEFAERKKIKICDLCVLCCKILFILLGVFAANVRGEEEADVYKVKSVKAFLYYTDTGTFSENVIDSKNFEFWNVIIGEGSAKGPSDATMVVVEVVGRSNLTQPIPKIEFTATESGKAKLSRISHVHLDRNGKYFAAFWIYDTGCAEVTINVKLSDQTKSPSIEKKIPFSCGE
jgi:hypothetical protein